MFNLVADPWIRVVTVTGVRLTVSIGEITKIAANIRDINEPPMTRIAILRLLLALRIEALPIDGLTLYHSCLETQGLPAESARPPFELLSLQDARNTALSPIQETKEADDPSIARALVTAYFCDRPGLKTPNPGSSISGQRPSCVGSIIAFPLGDSDTLGSLLRASVNMIGDDTRFLSWPWRKVLAVPNRGIVVCAGIKAPDDMIDPFSWGKAKRSHMTGIEIPDGIPPGRYDVTALVLNQALPLACWREIVTSSPHEWGFVYSSRLA